MDFGDHQAIAEKKPEGWSVRQIRKAGSHDWRPIYPIPLDDYKRLHGEPKYQKKEEGFDWR